MNINKCILLKKKQKALPPFGIVHFPTASYTQSTLYSSLQIRKCGYLFSHLCKLTPSIRHIISLPPPHTYKGQSHKHSLSAVAWLLLKTVAILNPLPDNCVKFSHQPQLNSLDLLFHFTQHSKNDSNMQEITNDKKQCVIKRRKLEFVIGKFLKRGHMRQWKVIEQFPEVLLSWFL